MSRVRTVPIFPLDGVLLCPGLGLPLHIFEPRYRAMLQHVMDGDRHLAMCTPVDGHSVANEEDPPVHPVCGLGEVIQHQPMPDGRSNILLSGVARFRILEELPRDEAGFRLVRGEVVEEIPVDDDVDVVSDALRLTAELARLGVAKDEGELAALSTQQLVDTAILALPIPLDAKVRLFGEESVRARLRGLLAQMPLGAAE